MHPQIHMESRGQCPICGMDLVPVKKEDQTSTVSSSAHATQADVEKSITINPSYVQNIGVTTEKAAIRDLKHIIHTYGKIAHDHRLWIAQNEYLEALKLKDPSLIKASEHKLLFLGLSETWIQTLKKTKSADMTLHLKTSQSKPKYIEAYVYQDDIATIHEGDAVEITDQKGGFLSKGEVKAIGTLVNLESRSVRVLVESQSPLNLKLNTFVQVNIELTINQQLSIPTQAILFNGDHNMVYLTHGKGIFEPRVIELGTPAGDYYTIRSGLKEGDEVVTNGHFLIDSETQIKLGGDTHAHHH